MTSNTQHTARAPKYYSVKLHLLEYIDSLEQGAPVPTERDLAADLGTSRTTVRQALVELVAEGRLVRRQGSGTYVADAKITWPLQLASFTEQAIANGQVASSQLLGVQRLRADEELAERLDLAVGDGVHQIDRLRLADGRPTAVETALLSATRFPYLGRKMRYAGSLEALLANEYGVKLRGGEATIDTMPASPREAGLLEGRHGLADAGRAAAQLRHRAARRSSGARAGSAATGSPSSPSCPCPADDAAPSGRRAGRRARGRAGRRPRRRLGARHRWHHRLRRRGTSAGGHPGAGPAGRLAAARATSTSTCTAAAGTT